VAIAALVLLLLYGCARPQGTVAKATIQPSATPVAARAPLTIASPVFHSGEVGVNYAPVALSASGGVAPYTWTVIGSLPDGLAMSSDGVVSGTPSQNGYFAFGVQVLDFGKNDTAGLPVNIPILPRLAAGLVSGCATECTVELGCVSVCGTFGQVSGGAAPITYSLTSGPLPAGTTLNGLSLNGTFTGLPGRLQFTVQVTDGFGATTIISPRYNLLPHLSASSGTCSTKFYTTACSTLVTYSGGTPGFAATVGVVAASGQYCSGYNRTCQTVTTPPPGFSATSSPGSVVVTVPAATYPGFSYLGTVTLRLTDQNLCGSNTKCTTSTTVTINYS
jgi:hypothetical protein